MKTHKFPGGLDLVECWMATHYKGRPCVVFSNPMDFMDVIAHHFPKSQRVELISSAYAVLPCRSLKEANRICNATPDSAPYCIVWDGTKTTNENT